MKKTFRLATCILGLSSALLAEGVPVVDYPAYSALPVNSQANVAAHGLSGIRFTLKKNILVTHLGFAAINMGGGDLPHVTLWKINQGYDSMTLLHDTGNLSPVITAYASDDLRAEPSFISLDKPILLESGGTYLLSAPAYWVATYAAKQVKVDPGSMDVFAEFLFVKGAEWVGWENEGYRFTALTSQSDTLSAVVNFRFNLPDGNAAKKTPLSREKFP